MASSYVTTQEFKRLEHKVKELTSLHEIDRVLTGEEKKLVNEVKEDLRNKRKENFISVEKI